VVGANAATVRSLARAVVERDDLADVPVSVIAGFPGSTSASDPSRGPAVRRGEPSLAEFRQQLGDAAAVVNLVAGDVPSLRWSGRPIELLVIGWSRDQTRLAHAWRELLPWCIPGGSLILIEGLRDDPPGPSYQELGWLRAHLEVLGAGRHCLALAPVSTPDPAALRSLALAPDRAGWSTLGVPAQPEGRA
jgi:hypothetical protein